MFLDLFVFVLLFTKTNFYKNLYPNFFVHRHSRFHRMQERSCENPTLSEAEFTVGKISP